MRIFWQSFVDASVNAPYMARLSEYLNTIDRAQWIERQKQKALPVEAPFAFGRCRRAYSE